MGVVVPTFNNSTKIDLYELKDSLVYISIFRIARALSEALLRERWKGGEGRKQRRKKTKIYYTPSWKTSMNSTSEIPLPRNYEVTFKELNVR